MSKYSLKPLVQRRKGLLFAFFAERQKLPLRLRSEAEVSYLNATGLRRHDNTLIPDQARACKTTADRPINCRQRRVIEAAAEQQQARQGSMQRLQQQLKASLSSS